MEKDLFPSVFRPPLFPQINPSRQFLFNLINKKCPSGLLLSLSRTQQDLPLFFANGIDGPSRAG